MKNFKTSFPIAVLAMIVLVLTSATVILLPSSVYEWANLKVTRIKNVEVRQIIKSATKSLESLDVSTTTITQAGKFTIGSAKDGLEAFIILKEGKIKFNQNGQDVILNPGTVILFPPGISRVIENVGDGNISFYTVKWKSPSNHATDPKVKTDQPIVYDYDKLEFKKTAKGGGRAIMNTPTQSLIQLEMHTTMLNEGETSHAAHVHHNEEMMIVRYGTVAEMIVDKDYVLGPGSVIFLASDDLHGIRNAGKGPCEYFAIKWSTEKTEVDKQLPTQN